MVARARAMIPTLRERAPQGERERRLPKETIADMQAAGLFKVLQPRRWGGYELDILTYFECQMALGEGDMSVAWVYGVVGVHPWLVALLRRPGGGRTSGARTTSTLICSSLMPVGMAKPVDGGFRFSGHWKYASGCEHAQWVFLGGVPPGGAMEERRIFLVPRGDFEIVDTWHVAGLKGTGSHDIVVKDAFVPAHRTLKYSDNFRGWGPGLATNSGAALSAAVRPSVLPRRFDRRDRRAARHAQRLSRLRQEAHQPAVGHAGVGGSVDPADLRRDRLALDEMKTILHRNFRISKLTLRAARCRR